MKAPVNKISTGNKNNPNNWLYLLLIVIAYWTVYAIFFDPKLDLNGDNATYIQLARNIANSYGYADVGIHGATPASHFPPAYSAFLSIFIWLGIDNLVFFKLLNGILLFASYILLFFIVKHSTKNKILSFSSVAVGIFAPSIMRFATICMSEVLFGFCCIACFFCMVKYHQRKDSIKFYKSPYFYLAILFAAISYYTRAVGAAMLFSLIVFFVFRKEWLPTLSAIVGIVLCLLPWQLRNNYYHTHSRYFDTVMTVNPWRPEEGKIASIGEFVDKMITNLDDTTIKGFKQLLFPFLSVSDAPSGIMGWIAGLLILGIIFLGAYNMGKFRWVTLAFLLGNIGVFMLWHGGNGTRYVTPIVPILFVCFYIGIYALFKIFVFKNKENKLFKYLPYAFLLMILFNITPIKSQAIATKRAYPPAFVNYFNIAKKLNKEQGTRNNIVVACRKPELFAAYAPDVFTTRYVFSSNTNEVLQGLVNDSVDYVVLEQLGYSSTGLYLYPCIQANPNLFPIEKHLKNPDTYLLKFERISAIELLNKNAELVLK